jgi:hypothetical protein
VEAHHNLAIAVENRPTSRDGKVSKSKISTHVLLQIFLYPFRLIHLSATVDGASWSLRRVRAPRCDRSTTEEQIEHLRFIASNEEEDNQDEIDVADCLNEGIEDVEDPSSNSNYFQIERLLGDILNTPLESYVYHQQVQIEYPDVRLGSNESYPVTNYDKTETRVEPGNNAMDIIEYDDYIEEADDNPETIVEMESNTALERNQQLLYKHPVDNDRYAASQQEFLAALYNSQGRSDDLQEIRNEENSW